VEEVEEARLGSYHKVSDATAACSLDAAPWGELTEGRLAFESLACG
jgi:hypothetical protein